MRYVIIFFLFITSAQALPFTLNTQDILTIKKAYENKKITTRLLRYKDFLKEVESFHLEKKLNRVNSYINKIRSKHDKVTNINGGENAIGDYWMTPKEFFLAGSGDCEDYAIAKMYTLLYLGIDPKHLYLTVVKVKGSNSFHMILLYVPNKKSMPLVLDNLSWKILPFNQRKDLTPLFAFNEIDSYNFFKKKIHQKIDIDWGRENKWENLLKRID